MLTGGVGRTAVSVGLAFTPVTPERPHGRCLSRGRHLSKKYSGICVLFVTKAKQ